MTGREGPRSKAYHLDSHSPLPPLEVIARDKYLVQKMLDHGEWGSNRLIAHSTSIVTLMRGLGRSLGHIISHHVNGGAEGGANMAKLNMMAKHVHAHVDVAGPESQACLRDEVP